MKKLLITCSMISACALVACADTPSVQGTPKTQELAWFDVSTTSTNGGTLASNGDALLEIVTENETSKFEIDSDLANPVVFTATDSLTQAMAKVTFNLDAAIVPNNALQTFDTANAPKVAFALYQEDTDPDTKVFKAWTGVSWLTLTGTTVPTEGSAYTLTMEFDNTASEKKVRFLIGNTALKYSDAEWIPYSSAVTNEVAVNFVGCGKVASFVGKQISVIGEIIVIEGKGSVDIDNATKTAFEKVVPAGKTVDEFLASNAKASFESSAIDSNLMVAEAYALGLIVKSGDTMVPLEDGNGALKVKADAQASTEGGIPVKLNIQPPDDSGAKISYQVQGSTDGTSFTAIEGATATKIEEIKIPTDYVDGSNDKPKYRFFKVVTTVTLEGGETPAQQD